MKKIFLFLPLIFVACNLAEPSSRKGCMDSKALNFDPYAKEDDGNCEYGGLISISRAGPNSNEKDSVWMMRDSVNGHGHYRKRNLTKYNEFLSKEVECFSGESHINSSLPIGKWKVYFLKSETDRKDTILISDTLIFEVTDRSCFFVKLK